MFTECYYADVEKSRNDVLNMRLYTTNNFPYIFVTSSFNLVLILYNFVQFFFFSVWTILIYYTYNRWDFSNWVHKCQQWNRIMGGLRGLDQTVSSVVICLLINSSLSQLSTETYNCIIRSHRWYVQEVRDSHHGIHRHR